MIKKKSDTGFQEFQKEAHRLAESGVWLADTHAHIHFEPLSLNVPELIRRAAQWGVEKIMTIGIDREDSAQAVALADIYPEVYASVGVHPHDACRFSMAELPWFDEQLSRRKVVAVGEIGLDFFRNKSTVEEQERVFLTFLELAVRVKRPVIVHNRDAHKRTMELLAATVAGRENNGIIHCFSGDKALLTWALDNGFYISYAGPVTYSSAEDLRETVRYVPLDRLLTETDCPYLAPVPFRGETNEPAYAALNAWLLAELKAVPYETLVRQMQQNVRKVFSLEEE